MHIMQMKIQLGKDSGHPHVPVMINGQGPFTFVLDTGASMTTISKSLVDQSISKSLVDQLGIQTYEGEKKGAVGVGGNEVSVKTALLETFEIGGLAHQDEEVGVIDFESIFGSQGHCGYGVIGHSILKNYKVRVHYGSLFLRMEKSNGYLSDDKLEWIPFNYLADTHLIGVPVFINGKGPIDHILDTGSSGNVMTPSVAVELGVSEQLPNSAVEATGCSGGESALLSDTIMGVMDLAIACPDGKKIDYGIIGYPFLKDYELVIDYPNQKLALVKHNQN
jgi:hypothetical protein